MSIYKVRSTQQQQHMLHTWCAIKQSQYYLNRLLEDVYLHFRMPASEKFRFNFADCIVHHNFKMMDVSIAMTTWASKVEVNESFYRKTISQKISFPLPQRLSPLRMLKERLEQKDFETLRNDFQTNLFWLVRWKGKSTIINYKFNVTCNMV